MDGEAWVSPTAERTGTEPHDDRTSVPDAPRGAFVSNTEAQLRWGATARCVSEVRRWDVHDAFRQTPLGGQRWGHGADT